MPNTRDSYTGSDQGWWWLARILASPLIVALVFVWVFFLAATILRDTLSPMNPLAQLPPSTSPQFALDKIDVAKIGRFALMQGAAFLLSLVPLALGAHYVIKGVDVTGVVVILIGSAAEALRRFLVGQPK